MLGGIVDAEIPIRFSVYGPNPHTIFSSLDPRALLWWSLNVLFPRGIPGRFLRRLGSTTGRRRLGVTSGYGMLLFLFQHIPSEKLFIQFVKVRLRSHGMIISIAFFLKPGARSQSIRVWAIGVFPP